MYVSLYIRLYIIYIMVINNIEWIYDVWNVPLPNTSQGERNDMV